MAKAIFAENALNAIYVSTSWRITAPVRWVGMQVKLLRQRGLIGRLRDLVKKIRKPLPIEAIDHTNVDALEITDSPYLPVLITTKPTPLALHIHHKLKVALAKKRASLK
jgi:hypothetical protein